MTPVRCGGGRLLGLLLLLLLVATDGAGAFVVRTPPRLTNRLVEPRSETRLSVSTERTSSGTTASSTGNGGPRPPRQSQGLLTLTNPMKIVQLPSEPPRRDPSEQSRGERAPQGRGEWAPPNRGERAPRGDDRGGDGPSARRAVGSASTAGRSSSKASNDSDDFGGAAAIAAPPKPYSRAPIGVGPKKQGGGQQNRKGATDDGAGRRQSLRVGTTRRGRSAEEVQRRGSLKRRNRAADKAARAEANLERRRVVLKDGPITVSELAEAMDEKPVAVIKFLMTDLGIMASMTQSLDPATCVAVVEGFGKFVAGSDEDDEESDDDDGFESSALETGVAGFSDDESDMQPRPPVVTIMGHVDHGKTSLLDAIRNTRVTAGEAGGITQHIQAYQVQHNGKPITFIDTPGHAAFTDMRQRGANVTDIVILVVAADDGVKQQTADSIVCARQAGVPVVVAINKCDLETADVNRVLTELTGYDILTEDLGGEVLCSQISAKVGTNLDDLLDKIMLQAEVQDLKANSDRKADGIIIEANIEKGLGTVATTLIKGGSLKVGDIFVAGETFGKVKALISTNDGKSRLEEAGPSMPVMVAGFEGVPNAGDILVVCDDEQTARNLAESRQRIALERQSSSYQTGLFDSVSAAFGNRKMVREMCVLVKADVQGTAEALTRSLRELKLENDEAVVTIKVLVSEAGEVTKSDIAIASVTPGTTVLAFNVAANIAAMEDARALDIPIEYYSVVYDAIESIQSRMQEVLSPTPDGEYVGEAVVQEVFNIGGTGNIAGSRCTKGYLKKGANARVMRGDKILCETKIKTLRSFKAEADQIESGSECGIGLSDFENFEAGDVIECYVE